MAPPLDHILKDTDRSERISLRAAMIKENTYILWPINTWPFWKTCVFPSLFIYYSSRVAGKFFETGLEQ